VDNSGNLDRSELAQLLRSFFMRNNLFVPVDAAFVDDVFVDLDIDQNGRVDINELMNFFGPFNTMMLTMFRSAAAR
jgi:Ca2+-binding EF-hand superfamily protein